MASVLADFLFGSDAKKEKTARKEKKPKKKRVKKKRESRGADARDDDARARDADEAKAPEREAFFSNGNAAPGHDPVDIAVAPRTAPPAPPARRRNGAKCMQCGRRVEPATVDGFEAHSLRCARNPDAWAFAAARTRADPASLVDEPVELFGGLSGVVVAVRPRLVRRWLRPRHEVLFDSGRREEVLLADGVDGAAFRLLDAAEAAERDALRHRRLELELERAKAHAAELERARASTDRARDKELHRAQKKLEDATLCVVCLDRDKNVAFGPCGHRSCSVCAAALRNKPCPVCRRRVERVIKVYQ